VNMRRQVRRCRENLRQCATAHAFESERNGCVMLVGMWWTMPPPLRMHCHSFVLQTLELAARELLNDSFASAGT
jgi:hypothetical protein